MTPSVQLPTIVAISEEELAEIKSMLKEILESLRMKEQEEINNQWLESSVARKMLGVSAKTWQDYRDKRVIPFSQFGRKIYVRRADIEAFLQQHYIKASKSKTNWGHFTTSSYEQE